MSAGLKASSDGLSAVIQVGGVDKVTIGASGIAAGSYAPASITPTELSQKPTLGTAVNTTSGTAIDFTSIPSWVKRITVMLNGVSTNGTSNTIIQLGAGSITASGYAGQCARQGAAANNYTSLSTGFILDQANTAATTSVGHLVITHVGSNLWVSSGVITNSAAANESCTIAGSISLSGTLDRLRLTTVGGTDTFDAGSVNILYE